MIVEIDKVWLVIVWSRVDKMFVKDESLSRDAKAVFKTK